MQRNHLLLKYRTGKGLTSSEFFCLFIFSSFDANEVFSNQKESIPEATVLTLDSKTGKIMNSWGQNM